MFVKRMGKKVPPGVKIGLSPEEATMLAQSLKFSLKDALTPEHRQLVHLLLEGLADPKAK